ncbi:linker for activation of T-cells family member 2 isoform X4 [Rattus norvegicus]|uniref:linker for activation of T-cells family member 2 isoform X4 n=1 Tax=Rattus norvegicus TaxID=10116 RepID=UPI0019176796|nr:linker for activation of T-cells family member 2 isoform X5 [Rattus norvegicus]
MVRSPHSQISNAALQLPPQANMSAELELLWPLSGLLLLLLLGTTAWLCVQCSRPGVKRNEKIYEQRNQQENEQSVASSQTYSLARPVRTGLQMDAASNKSFERVFSQCPCPILAGRTSCFSPTWREADGSLMLPM